MLIRMSISGGILIFLILVLRLFTVQKLPKRLFVLLWDIAMLRLLLPVSIPVRLPANHVTTALRNAGNTAFVLHGNEIPISETASGHYEIQNILFLLWLLGTAVWSVVFTYRYRKEYGKIKEALPLSPEDEKELRTLVQIPGWVTLKKSDQILTPVSFGFIHPRILLSSVFPVTDRTQLTYVLTHELVHIKRMDYVRKLMMAAAVCLHWWNPAVWVMQYLYSRDLELSCDEKVVSLFGEDKKEEYALTLLTLAQIKSSAFWFTSGFGKHAVKERIEAIMKFKKLTVMTLAAAVLLAGTAITAFAKNTTKENFTTETPDETKPTATEYVSNGDADNQITGLEKTDDPMVYTVVAAGDKGVDSNKEIMLSVLSYGSDGITGRYCGKQIAGLFDCESGMTFVMDTADEENSVYLKVKGKKLTEITKEEFNRLAKAAEK